MHLTFRRPTQGDLPSIAAIYNHAVLHTTFAFDADPKPPSAFECFVHPPYSDSDTDACSSSTPPPPPPPQHLNRMIVAVKSDTTISTKEVVGYAGTYPFSARPAYAQLAEIMVYVSAEHQGQGIGRALLRHVHHDSNLLEGLHTTVGFANAENGAVLKLLRDIGYVERGVLVDVAVKFGTRHSLVMLQKMLTGDGNVAGNGDEEVVSGKS